MWFGDKALPVLNSKYELKIDLRKCVEHNKGFRVTKIFSSGSEIKNLERQFSFIKLPGSRRLLTEPAYCTANITYKHGAPDGA